MYTISHTTKGQNLRQASGEELLLLAVLGPSSLKPRIDQELDRRALAGITGGVNVMIRPISMISGRAA
jgi:hypothetical protein